jgi:septation ring formation regulator EzrA
MTQLTSALEKLSQAIDKLETALDTRVKSLEKNQQDLFSQLETERDANTNVKKELDDIILQMEKTLTSNAA